MFTGIRQALPSALRHLIKSRRPSWYAAIAWLIPGINNCYHFAPKLNSILERFCGKPVGFISVANHGG
jgi:hypothetical protein